jgi:formylglycine-generating enzyme
VNAAPPARARLSPWAGLLLGSWLLACSGETPARDQWLVVVDSDAPVPVLGDRLLVELLDNEGQPMCDTCRRQFGLDELEPWPVSFGIAAEEISAPIVRARLYRAVNADSEGLPRGALLDAAYRLPHAAGVTPVRIELRMACLGLAVDLAEGVSCEGDDARKGPIAVAPRDHGKGLKAWPLAKDTACEGDAPTGSVCVEGGAFVRGDMRALELVALVAPIPEELTVLSAFYLDQAEFTVGQYRQLRLGAPTLPEPFTASAQVSRFCTYLGELPGQNDPLPLNCVTHQLAEQVCEARGMRLPTEAEWEFAAGNRDLETRFPWGEDTTDLCLRTIYGLSYEAVGVGSSNCRLQRPAGDQEPGVRAGGAEGDVTALGLQNLAGNLSEWVSDALVSYADPCWARSPWLRDPSCNATAPLYALRGGNWRDGAFGLESTTRDGLADLEAVSVGFRCAKSAGSQ